MILRDDFDIVFCWESTTLSNTEDVDCGSIFCGVQLVPLSERINKYNGSISYRPLNIPLNENQIDIIKGFRKDLIGRPYEQKKSTLIKAALKLGKFQDDISSIFCSELIASVYQKVGLLLSDNPADYYTPADFSYSANPGIPFINGFSLGEEIPLKY